MRRGTQTIPIVFASLGDPIGSGLVASINRPGGNVTGFAAFVDTMGGKWLELIREIPPAARRASVSYTIPEQLRTAAYFALLRSPHQRWKSKFYHWPFTMQTISSLR